MNDDVANRTLNGPWECVSLVPDWIKRCCFNSYSNVMMYGTKDNFDFNGILKDIVCQILMSPIDVYSFLNSMHLFTSQKALDVNLMVLSCFNLAINGFFQYCPLHVMALGMRGFNLNNKQKKELSAFCHFLIDKIETSILHQGWFREAHKAEIIDWLNFGQAEYAQVAQFAHEQRSTDDGISTCFIRPKKIELVTREVPEWAVKTSQRNTSTSAQDQRRIKHIMKSSTTVIAELWAKQQSDDKEKKRQEMLQEQVPLHNDLSKLWRVIFEGTRLPNQGVNKSNDKHHLNFDNPHTTGILWHEAIEKCNDMKGLYQHILQFCALSPSTTRKEFVKAIINATNEPDLIQRLKIFDNMKFVNKYWDIPILDPQNSTMPFEWGVMPHLQYSSGFGSVDGVESVMGVDVFWLVVSQALYCKEWQAMQSTKTHSDVASRRREPRRFVSPEHVHVTSTTLCDSWQICIHLRNMSHASEVLMMLMVHLQLEKAALPIAVNHTAGKKYLVLNYPQANQMKESMNAYILYEPRLHLDSFDADFQSDVSNVLCWRQRDAAHFKLVELNNLQTVLFYDTILKDTDTSWIPNSAADLMVFPPESFYHMHTHMRLWRTAYKALVETLDKTLRRISDKQAFTLAMQVFGNSATCDNLRFICPSLTNSVVQDEIPCVTYQGSYMFTLRRDKDANNNLTNNFRITPCEPAFCKPVNV